MGAAPSSPSYGGETRIGSGAQTHFRGWGLCLTLAAMVREMKLSPDGEVECYPLSPMQQGMLFHRLGGSARGVDLEQVICELHEEIHAAKFERAWREVIARHAALRTSFAWETETAPRQMVFAPSRVWLALHHEDFGSESEARRGLQEYLSADRREGFHGLTPPLLRVALLRGGPAHFWFVTTYHHLLLDARSMTVLFREVMELHDALVEGRALELPKPRPYRGFIDWLQRRDASGDEMFWREQLRGLTSPTVLPIARHGALPPAEQEDVSELAFRLSAADMTALRAAGEAHRVTVNTLVQAAWAVVLARYAGEEDIVFGAVRAGRKVPVDGAASIVGLFINTVPVRVKVASETPLGTWLRSLREQWVAMRAHEHASLADIQRWSDVTPGLPLFESILSYQEPAWDAALTTLGGRWARRSFDIRAQPNYPLALEVLAGEALTVKAVFDPARFGAQAIARLLTHVRVVLEALAANNVATVGALPLLTPEETHTLTTTWNDTAALYPRQLCVHTLVEAHAVRAPESIAVTDTHNALTYGELNTRANRLAHRLRSLGVERDALVGVCMDRSIEMMVAWLGVAKAGGAFVPLDPAYPKERLAFQIQDSAASVLLVQPATRAQLPAVPAGVHVVELLQDGSGFESEADANPACTVAPCDLAYVIYTSGSTGQPKGVGIEHRALMNLVTWHQRVYAVTTADRASHLASPAFDAAVWEIWPYLTAGASVHIPDEESRLGAALVWRWMAHKKITIAFMPTPLAEAAMNETWPEDLALRALLTGGDKLKTRPPRDFPCALINHYGPTESAVVATSALIDPEAPAGAVLPIGRPVANTRVYVLDRKLRLVPVGVPGELFIGGESLARGYHHRPELTREKFVADPFDPRDGARLYRTGDRVRWSAGGELEFIGRIDGQVKIRGCRVELGEIEAALQQHAAVRECIVTARADDRGGLQVIAHVVAMADATVTGCELIDFLREKLPAYMVPSAVVVLEAWPLTPNGKVDRAALPAAPFASSRVADETSGPKTEVEETVGRVWAEVLGRPKVGRDDNFFDLGGHSLLAAQVVARLNATLQGAVSVRALFDQPTLAGFARVVEQRLEGAPMARPPMQRSKRRVVRPDLELQPN